MTEIKHYLSSLQQLNNQQVQHCENNVQESVKFFLYTDKDIFVTVFC